MLFLESWRTIKSPLLSIHLKELGNNIVHIYSLRILQFTNLLQFKDFSLFSDFSLFTNFIQFINYLQFTRVVLILKFSKDSSPTLYYAFEFHYYCIDSFHSPSYRTNKGDNNNNNDSTNNIFILLNLEHTDFHMKITKEVHRLICAFRNGVQSQTRGKQISTVEYSHCCSEAHGSHLALKMGSPGSQ